MITEPTDRTEKTSQTDRRRRALALTLVVLLVGFGLRVSQSFFSANIFDQGSYEAVVAIMRHGGNVYAETNRYNYSPVWAYILLILSFIGDWTHIPLYITIRAFLSLIDVCNALLIGLIAEKVRPGTGRISMVGYLLNPLAILIVGFDGQFECLATLPLLLAVWLYLRSRRSGPTWALVTAAIVIKHIVVFSAWMLLVYVYKPRRAVLLMVASLAIFALSFAPYLPDGASGIYHNVLRYTSLVGAYGLGIFLPAGIASIVFITAMTALPLIARYRLGLSLTQAMLLSAVGFVAFIYGIGDQYFILVVLWAAIQPTRYYWLYTFVAALTIPVPWNVVAQSVKDNGAMIVLMLNAVWLTSVVLFVRNLRVEKVIRPLRTS